MEDIDPRTEEERMESKEDKMVCKLDGENHFTYMGSSILKEEMGVLVKILQKNRFVCLECRKPIKPSII